MTLTLVPDVSMRCAFIPNMSLVTRSSGKMLSFHVKFVQTDRQMDRQMNGQTDRQWQNNMPPIFRYGGIKMSPMNLNTGRGHHHTVLNLLFCCTLSRAFFLSSRLFFISSLFFSLSLCLISLSSSMWFSLGIKKFNLNNS